MSLSIVVCGTCISKGYLLDKIIFYCRGYQISKYVEHSFYLLVSLILLVIDSGNRNFQNAIKCSMDEMCPVILATNHQKVL